MHIDNSLKIFTDRLSFSSSDANNNMFMCSINSDYYFPPNTSVKVCVNPIKRQILSECHTAGHVVDAAMAKCDMLLPPTKGYHFLDGPYVEYKGNIDLKEREEFLGRLKIAYQVSIILYLLSSGWNEYEMHLCIHNIKEHQCLHFVRFSFTHLQSPTFKTLHFYLII